MRVLAAGTRDRDAWLAAWSRCGREPFAHPDYVAQFARDEATPLAVLHEQEAGQVLLPLLRRRLPEGLDGPGAADLRERWTDAVSPYGYGGPYSCGDVDWRAFYVRLLDWMRSEQVLTAFVRGDLDHPARGWTDVPGYRAVSLADNVRVDLTRPEEAQWRGYAHKVRKNVNKARRAGLTCRISEGFVDLPSFLEVYRSTMDRRSADSRYYFDETFFERVGSIEGCALVADVLDGEGRVVSTELVLVSDRHLYSFLGGTREDAYVHAPNDLLKHEVISYGRAAGKLTYVLGGGYQADDGIFRYKRGFDEEGVVGFHGLQLIGDPAIYASLLDGVETGGAFFPAYRQGR